MAAYGGLRRLGEWFASLIILTCWRQGRIKTKLGLMLLPGKGPIFFSAFKTDQEVQDP